MHGLKHSGWASRATFVTLFLIPDRLGFGGSGYIRRAQGLLKGFGYHADRTLHKTSRRSFKNYPFIASAVELPGKLLLVLFREFPDLISVALAHEFVSAVMSSDGDRARHIHIYVLIFVYIPKSTYIPYQSTVLMQLTQSTGMKHGSSGHAVVE